MISCARMTISLTILPGPRVLDTKPGTTILKAAHAGGVDINAICGGRGRCTSCRVKLVAGTAPPPTIMDELQLGDALVREGYRLSCQWPVTEPITVQVAPPLDDTTFQILGGERPAGAPAPISIDAGIRKRAVQVALPKEEHVQTSDWRRCSLRPGARSRTSRPRCSRPCPRRCGSATGR